MDKAREILMFAMAVILILSFLILLALLVFQEVPVPNSQLLYTMVGVFGTMAVTVINYYFGSSKGSSDKTKIIANGNTPK